MHLNTMLGVYREPHVLYCCNTFNSSVSNASILLMGSPAVFLPDLTGVFESDVGSLLDYIAVGGLRLSGWLA